VVINITFHATWSGGVVCLVMAPSSRDLYRENCGTGGCGGGGLHPAVREAMVIGKMLPVVMRCRKATRPAIIATSRTDYPTMRP